MIEFACATCGTKMRVPDTYAGKRGRCRKCGATLLAPTVEEVHAAVGGVTVEVGATTGAPEEAMARVDAPPPPGEEEQPLRDEDVAGEGGGEVAEEAERGQSAEWRGSDAQAFDRPATAPAPEQADERAEDVVRPEITVPEPAAELAAVEAHTEAPTPEPVAEVPAVEAQPEAPAPEPVAEVPVVEAQAEGPTPEPIAEAPVEEVQPEVSASEWVAEAPAVDVQTEGPAPEPVAELPVSEPAPEMPEPAAAVESAVPLATDDSHDEDGPAPIAHTPAPVVTTDGHAGFDTPAPVQDAQPIPVEPTVEVPREVEVATAVAEEVQAIAPEAVTEPGPETEPADVVLGEAAPDTVVDSEPPLPAATIADEAPTPSPGTPGEGWGEGSATTTETPPVEPVVEAPSVEAPPESAPAEAALIAEAMAALAADPPAVESIESLAIEPAPPIADQPDGALHNVAHFAPAEPAPAPEPVQAELPAPEPEPEPALDADEHALPVAAAPVPAPVEEDNWYYYDDGQLHGPTTQSHLRDMVAPSSLVWQPGMDAWLVASTLLPPARGRQVPELPPVLLARMDEMAAAQGDLEPAPAAAVAPAAYDEPPRRPPPPRTLSGASSPVPTPAQGLTDRAPWANLSEHADADADDDLVVVAPTAPSRGGRGAAVAAGGAAATTVRAVNRPPRGSENSYQLKRILAAGSIVVALVLLVFVVPKLLKQRDKAASDAKEAIKPGTGVPALPEKAHPDDVRKFVESARPFADTTGSWGSVWDAHNIRDPRPLEEAITEVDKHLKAIGPPPDQRCQAAVAAARETYAAFRKAVEAWQQESPEAKGANSQALFDALRFKSNAFTQAYERIGG